MKRKRELKLKDNNLKYLKDRNMSILDFNMRVLMLACDTKVPMIERLNFIKIVFSNLDEFISVRLPEDPSEEYMSYISHIYDLMDEIFKDNISIGKFEFDYSMLSKRNFGNNTFNDGEIYYIGVTNTDEFLIYKYKGIGIIEMDDLVRLQNPNKKVIYSFLVRFISDKSFRYVYSGEGINKVVEEINNVVKIKENIIFTYIQTTCENDMIMDKFLEFINLSISGYFYLSEDILQIESIVDHITKKYNSGKLYYKEFTPHYTSRDYYEHLKSKEYIVYNPYISYDEVLDFINQMCNHPNIQSVFITLYRTSHESKIITSLIEAKEKGKQVYVYVEPTARGNEESNIEIINRLMEYGIIVSCNYFTYKIHSKIFLAVDKSGTMYSHIGTGNYNEKTAKAYTDLHMLTTDENITKNVYMVFKNIFNKTSIVQSKPIISKSKDIIVSPITLRGNIISLIKREIDKGMYGRIYFKCNSLCDETIINWLYEAANCGVDVKLLVRTAVGILPTDNLEIRSKVGRFLEHERIYIFGDDVFISSADLLVRNIERRIEIMCRIKDQANIDFIENIFVRKWESDNSYILKEAPLRWVSKPKKIC